MVLDLSMPITSQKNLKFEYRSPLSSSRINSLMGSVHSDLNVLYDTGLQIEKNHLSGIERSLRDMEEIELEIEALISEVNRLLLVTEETAGTLATVGDNFENSSQTDASATTANIDRQRQVVTIAPLTGVATPESGIDLTQASIVISSLTAGQTTHETAPDNMLANSDDHTGISIISTTLIEAVISIQIDLTNVLVNGSRRPKEVSAISLFPFSLGRATDVLIQYSLDGIDWRPLPVADPARRTSGIVNYRFPKISLNFIKIFMSKQDFDEVDYRQNGSARYYYRFGIKKLLVSEEVRRLSEESVFQSTQLFPTGANGEPVKFTRAIISEICYEKPPGTSVEFYLSFLVRNNLDQITPTEFQQISPFQDVETDQIASKMADIGTIDRVVQNGIKIMPQPQEWAGFDALGTSYRGRGNPNRGILVTGIDDQGTLIKAESSDQWIEVWRNVGDWDSNQACYSPDGSLVPAGWRVDQATSNRMTYIKVEDRAGVHVDFGGNTIIIDSRRVKGRVFLAYGMHRIEILSKNWTDPKDGFALATSYDNLTYTFTGSRRRYGAAGTESVLVSAANETLLDSFYPYNHRLLVEGLDYHEDFLGERVYSGLGTYAAYYAEEVSAFDLEASDPEEYGKFSIVDVIEGVAPNITRSHGILMNLVDDPSHSNLEVSTVIMRSSDASIAEGVVFKAVLYTENETSTPSLEGYEIKMVR
jgi:hypothetical protein